MVSLQFFRIVATIFAAVNQAFKQLYDRVDITKIRYIFPTIRILGRIVQMYTDLTAFFHLLKSDANSESVTHLRLETL